MSITIFEIQRMADYPKGDGESMCSMYILKNLQMVDGSMVDITISNNLIQKITPVGSRYLCQSFDMKGLYVSSGWIDLHVHALDTLQPYGDTIDEIGIRQGVTTIVDAGSCGAGNMEELYQKASVSRTNVFAFLNVSTLGLTRMNELSNLDWIDEKELLEAVTRYDRFIVGLKARISSSVVLNNGIKPLIIAQNLSNLSNLPLMVHIGSSPPEITAILNHLKEDDIITHFLHGKVNNLFPNNRILSELLFALERGVHLDVGHGSASFSFPIAETAKRYGISDFTISSDIYRDNRENGPVFSLASVATKFLYLGYSLKEVIDAITIRPAKRINKPELGMLAEGLLANLTLFSVEEELVELIDSLGNVRYTDKQIKPKGVVINGEFLVF